MWSYNPKTNNWYKEKSMPFARCDFGFVAAHLQIYAIGGESDATKTPINSVIRYDPVNSTWQAVASMIFSRASAAIVEHHGFIWVAGGRQCDGGTYTKSVEYYDPMTDQWTRIMDLRIPRAFGRMCGIDNYLYIIGGCENDLHGNKYGLNSIDSCDINANHKSWSLLDKMLIDRYGHDVIEIDGKIIVIGGMHQDNKCLTNVECFCTKQVLWENCIRELPRGLTDLSVVTF